MRRTLTKPIRFIALLVLCASPANAVDQSRGIRDDGGFFAADAIKEAEAVVAQIQVVHQKDLRVETFPQIPQNLLAQFQQQGKERFFEQWADDRARKQLVDGVYILICRQPGRLQVWVGNHTAERLFSPADRQQLVNRLAASFQRRQFEAGLLRAVRFVQRQMDHHAAAPPDSRVPVIVQPMQTTSGDSP